MPEERVVVEADLGIEADELVALGDDERIDLEQAHILGDERGVELRHYCRGLLGEIVPQPQCLRQQAPVMRHDSCGGIDREGHDLLGMGARDLLDVHAARGRSHEGDARGLPVDQRGEIELPVDRRAFLDVEAVDLLAVRTGLMGHQDGADQALGLLAYVLGRLHDLNAAGLAAPTGMDLRLDDDDRRAEILSRLDRLLDRESGVTARHRHAELPQHRFGLIFVDVHRCSLTSPGYDAACSASARDGAPLVPDRHGRSGHHVPRFGAILMQASTRLDTDSTDFSNMARSAPFNWISTMRSTPFDPMTTGTPT